MDLRVVVWNAHGLRAGVAAAAEALARLRPDLVMLNEVGWSGWRLARLARALDARAASGLRRLRWSVTNAVLVLPPWRLLRTRTIRLPGRSRPHRGVVASLIGRSGYRLTAASVHLGLSDPERREHARDLTDRILPELRPPVLLGGDLNEPPEGPAARWMAERLWDAFAQAGQGPGETFPARDPRARIDYLLVPEGVTVARAFVDRDAAEASDHLPLVVDLELA
ncbi:MAG TPA: endonuclease/exonuclease/phosphatase family protein [Actinomycetota bacterium]